jgi:hypothetical protein
MTVVNPRSHLFHDVAMQYGRWRRQMLFIGASVLMVTVIALSQRLEKTKPQDFTSVRKMPHNTGDWVDDVQYNDPQDSNLSYNTTKTSNYSGYSRPLQLESASSAASG